MDKLKDILLSNDNTIILDSLKDFNSSNEKIFNFIKDNNENIKEECISNLLNIIKDNNESNICYEALYALKILSREPKAIDILKEDDNINILLSKSQLGTNFTNTEKYGPEACKCFVNIIVQFMKDEDLYKKFHDMGITQYCVNALKTDNLPDSYYFPIVRLFLQLVGRNSTIKTFAKNENMLECLVNIVIKYSNLYETNPEYKLIIIDSMSLIFILSQHLGPLEGSNTPSDEELNAFKKLIPIIQGYLSLPKDNPLTNSLVSSSIKCMINVPSVCTNDFKHEETLKSLLEYLVQKLSKPIEEVEAADITPVLLILNSISKAINESRNIIKDTIIPGWKEFEPENNMVDPPLELQNNKSLGYKLLECMTSSNPGLSHYSAELLFNLCNEDADEFVRIVGIGKGAGLLANRGLLNSFSSKINKPRQPQIVTEEDVEEWNKLMNKLEKHNKRQ